MGRGATVREADVQRPELVERNATVTIVYQTAGLNLTLRGRATAGGALGDTIQVQNLQSKKVIDAVVAGPGRVEVKAPDRPARAAAAPTPAVN
jgi:flagella basal body P-ring formation protein FlgA